MVANSAPYFEENQAVPPSEIADSWAEAQWEDSHDHYSNITNAQRGTHDSLRYIEKTLADRVCFRWKNLYGKIVSGWQSEYFCIG